jgi:disulfide oxidoreductase YuzD
MNWYKKAQKVDESKYPIANGMCDNLIVRKEIPNLSSISASLTNYHEIKGIRNIPMSEWKFTGASYSPQEDNRIKQLAREIKQSGEINPLIVVVDKNDWYILEGSHRAEALYLLGAKRFPALIIIDEEQ